MQNANRPEKNYKFGAVRASIWKDFKKDGQGRSFETVSVSIDRAYKDAQGRWQNTHSLKENDIPKAILALSKAYQYITEKETDSEPTTIHEETIE